ncbi:protein-glutamate methylesterase/protein-glutamine glutaminase [Carboxydothermus ferrireducens]|uniref:Protein-glutamate methylesterase/protein-glutamine glutaminase n=1 Tax=Carboxydothermus ferrireducens DSM 11255 TaxID=1119529 RepID=A0ABX2RAS8_9THEO|nr:chemotaxis response regulator protein-glutamate methylesterase [Carboxydothermus ferrireducens]NYE56873.1 two-component system chemotaxis response regulator CheB [Carboxydothermus ferrireducens DSM 11255]
MSRYKLFIVDDSALIRLRLKTSLALWPEIQIVGEAENGQEALKKIPLVKPDVVTLDLEMPVLDGLSTLKELNKVYPVPVIMLSSLTTHGAKATIEALENGAVDFVPKDGDWNKVISELKEKIKIAVSAKKRPKPFTGGTLNPKNVILGKNGRQLVVIGASTGGPPALREIIPKLPQTFPVPIVIIQHITRGFSKPLADQLARVSRLKVKEAEKDEQLLPGTVYVAPAGYTFKIAKYGSSLIAKIIEPVEYLPAHFYPSVDEAMLSAAEVAGSKTIGVLLTGMGKDGALGMKAIKERGGYTIAQDEETSVVYGMPKAAVDIGGVSRVLPLSAIAEEIAANI